MAPETDLQKFAVCPQQRRHAPERDEREHEQRSPNEKKTMREMRTRPLELHHDHCAQWHPTDRSLGQKSEGQREIKHPPPTAQIARTENDAPPGPAKPIPQQL